MKYSRVLLILICLFQVVSAVSHGQDGAKTPDGFRPLFNGQDLSGWIGLDPHAVNKLGGEKKAAKLAQMHDQFSKHWRVDGGELVNDGEGPYATTEESFGDYELMVEYKTSPSSDSGIYLRGMPQVQIWNSNQKFDPNNPNRLPHLGSGGLFNNTPNTLGRDPIMLADKPPGQWNALVIKHMGNRVWVRLNTKEVVDGAVLENFFDPKQPVPESGPIMLQTHGGEIRWRNIFIRDIKPAEAKRALKTPPLPNPTHYNVSYGPHRKQLIHFWKAESDKPTPLLFFIHGGGWMNGGRLSGLESMLVNFLNSGISVASIEYRFIPEATADGIEPPVKGPLHDAARALQFVRSQAESWNIDKSRIAASGGSAGACTSLWLAFHPDLADPQSDDSVARESTRLFCAAVTGAQTTLDPKQMRDWTPNSKYGGHAFGFMNDPNKRDSQFDQFYNNRDKVAHWIAEYSPYAQVSSDDPPVFLYYNTPPGLGQEQKDPTHTSNFGIKLQEHCQSMGVECELYYPDAPNVKHRSVEEYLIEKLTQSSTSK